MKMTYYFNLTCFLIVVALYFINPVLGGLAMLIPLAFIQIISSFFLLAERENFNEKNQKLLATYFFIIFGSVIYMVILSVLPRNLEFLFKILIFVPYILVILFVIICYSFYKERQSKINKI